MGKDATTIETDEVEVICTYWRNPITPSLATDFSLQTKDLNSNPIDSIASFSLDTTSYTPYQVPDAGITYGITTTTIQELTKYEIDIVSPVPLEITGCYLKLIFPRELLITPDLNTFAGEHLMLNPAGGSALTPEKLETAAAEKYVILKGCMANSLKKAK